MISKTNKGFTLIEIMVALAIGALLLSGIIQVFASLRTTDKLSYSLSRVQEAGRTALDIMSREIRMAGYKGCIDPSQIDPNQDIEIIAQNPPSQLALLSTMTGFETDALGWSAGFADLANIDGANDGDARLNSDVITTFRASEQAADVENHDNQSANIKVSNSSLSINQNMLAMITNCQQIGIFRVTNVTNNNDGTVTYAHGANNNTPNKFDRDDFDTSNNSQLLSLSSITYFVGDTGRTNRLGDPIFALYMLDNTGAESEIVEGVEYIQITYGQEFGNGNRRFVNANDINLDMDQVTSIKLSILVASNDRILETDDNFVYPLAGIDATPVSLGGALTYPNDRRLRKAFNMSINLRNRRIED